MRGSGHSYEGDNLIVVEPKIDVEGVDEDDEQEHNNKSLKSNALELPSIQDDEDLTYKSKKSFAYMKKGSVVAKVRHDGAEMRETHIEEENEKRKSELILRASQKSEEVEE